jgi:hypothetical protein
MVGLSCGAPAGRHSSNPDCPWVTSVRQESDGRTAPPLGRCTTASRLPLRRAAVYKRLRTKFASITAVCVLPLALPSSKCLQITTPLPLGAHTPVACNAACSRNCSFYQSCYPPALHNAECTPGPCGLCGGWPLGHGPGQPLAAQCAPQQQLRQLVHWSWYVLAWARPILPATLHTFKS